ncbi:hypothetical protein CN213_16140 [Sinorhizobium meliloti]|uniref:head-tail joining protein n=1 Tax=Rhizobium meliloti TaxID=382 RepID=UPI000FDC7F62|nr:hypothetical protein [Sinorhizobium meliloti]RVH56276.1 hypothetical protein CN213_16140 [Sinorhizobium meliloti]
MDWNGLLDGMTGIVRDTFGEPFTYTRLETGETLTHSVATGEELRGIYDAAWSPEQDGTALRVSASIPVLDVKLSDLGFEPATKDQLTVDGVSYQVNDKIPSSSGMMKLHLRKR